MTNNDLSKWADDYVVINDANHCCKRVRFGDLIEHLEAKPDVLEMTDSRAYATADDFLIAYSLTHCNRGYGDFSPNI